MTDLEQLATRVREHIPLTRHLDFQLESFADEQLILRAPLAANVNDKGTMFAGSQAALMALAGWCMTTLQAERMRPRMDVLAMQNSLHYQRPVTGDITIVVTATEEDLQRFRERLGSAQRAVLPIQAQGLNADGSLASSYQADYLARLL